MKQCCEKEVEKAINKERERNFRFFYRIAMPFAIIGVCASIFEDFKIEDKEGGSRRGKG